MRFSVFQVSRLGGRAKNEDRMGYCYTSDAALFLLADGMGGHPQGEVAAQLALQSMSQSFQRLAKPKLLDPVQFLAKGLTAAHQDIVRYASDRGIMDSPRTTLVAVLLQGGAAYWVHCGDSRMYLMRGSSLLMRTRDHSFVEHQDLTSVPMSHVNRNVLFTCLGSVNPPVFEVVGPVKLAHGDKILLCSDGLWDHVPGEQIIQLMSSWPVAQAVPELVEQALRNAGANSDNVTALGLEWEAPHELAGETRGVTTDCLSEGVFASTIEPLPSHDEPAARAADEWNDEAIERSIAEINEAIRRSAAAGKKHT